MRNQKLGLALIVMTLFSTSIFGNGDQQRGMSDERKLESFEKLKNYQPIEKKTSAKLTLEQQARRDKICSEYSHSQVKECLEDKYMDGEYFIVDITFINDQHYPRKPRIKYRRDKNNKQVEDKTEQIEYYRKWTKPILMEYLGEDYQNQFKAELLGTGSEVVGIRIKVLDPYTLSNLLNSPRIRGMLHIGVPPGPIEEIVN